MKLVQKLSLLTLLPLVLGTAVEAQSYSVRDLETLGGQYGTVTGLNNSGQVVGTVYIQDKGNITVLTRPGGAGPYKTLELNFFHGVSVNTLGQVAGQITNSTAHSHASLTGPQGSGIPKDLGSLGGDFSFAIGVNSSGQVSGTSRLSNNTQHAFLSGPNGGPLKDLGTLGGAYCYGVGVNDLGQVSGTSDTSASSPQFSVQHAFLSGPNGGPLKDLGLLGATGSITDSTLNSQSRGVNQRGQVTGSSQIVASFGIHAFLSGPNGGTPLQDLGTLSGDYSGGEDVNASGQVVGLSTYPGSTGQYDTHAFLYSGGVMTDLNSLIPQDSGIILTEGLAISNSGYILATGIVGGATHTILLTLGAAPPINTGPKLSFSVVASQAVDTIGTRSFTIKTTNTGGNDADQVEITGVTVNGVVPPASDIHNVLPTIKNLLPVSVSQTNTFVCSVTPGTTRAIVTLGGDYIDPKTGGLGHFSGTLRVTLPLPAAN